MSEVFANDGLKNTAIMSRPARRDSRPPKNPELSEDFSAAVKMLRHEADRPFHLLIAIDAHKDGRSLHEVAQTLSYRMQLLRKQIEKDSRLNEQLKVTFVINDGDDVKTYTPTSDLMSVGSLMNRVKSGGRSRIADMLKSAKEIASVKGNPYDAAIVYADHIDTSVSEKNLKGQVDTQANLVAAAQNLGVPVFAKFQIGPSGDDYTRQVDILHAMMKASDVNGWPMEHITDIKFSDLTPKDQITAPFTRAPREAIDWRRWSFRGLGALFLAGLIGVGGWWLTREPKEEPIVEVEPEPETPLYTFSGDDERFQFPRGASFLTDSFVAGLNENVVLPLIENPADIISEGHASPDGYIGNMFLSGQRASAVASNIEAQLLEANISIDIQEVQCGQSQPVFQDDGDFDMPASQRVVVHYADQYDLPDGCKFIEP